jgi:hypothetical protein
LFLSYPGTVIKRIDFNSNNTNCTFSTIADLQVYSEAWGTNVSNRYPVGLYTSHLSENCIIHVCGTYRVGEPYIHFLYNYNVVSNVLTQLTYEGSYHNTTKTFQNNGTVTLTTREGKYPLYVSNYTKERVYVEFNVQTSTTGLTSAPASSNIKVTIVNNERTLETVLLNVTDEAEFPYIRTEALSTISATNFMCYTAETDKLIALCFGYWVYANSPTLNTNRALVTRSFIIKKSDLSFTLVKDRTRHDYPHTVKYIPYLSTEK